MKIIIIIKCSGIQQEEFFSKGQVMLEKLCVVQQFWKEKVLIVVLNMLSGAEGVTIVEMWRNMENGTYCIVALKKKGSFVHKRGLFSVHQCWFSETKLLGAFPIFPNSCPKPFLKGCTLLYVFAIFLYL